MHRPAILTILSTIIIALISMPSVCDALNVDEQIEISYADMVFKVVDNNDVELTEVLDPDLKTIIVPATFEKDGETYTIVGIDGTLIYSDVVNRMEIPSTVTYIEGNFNGLSTLEWIDVDPSNKHLCSVDGVMYDINLVRIITYPLSKPDVTFDMPDTVTTVSEFCFAGSDNLESITMSNNIVLIERYAFDMCTSLEKINYDGTINKLPDTLRIIGEGAFSNCEKLTNVKLPESLIVIGDSAFNRCYALTSMFIPHAIVDIGSGFMSYCTNLGSIEVSELNTYFQSKDGILYHKHNNSSSISLHTYPCGNPNKSFKIPDDVNSIEPMAFNGTTHLEKLTLSNNMKVIGPYSIFGCETLQEVYIPSSVISVDNMAFCMCSNLSTVKGGNNVNIIDMMAFCSTNLTAAFLPDSLRILGKYAFTECNGITEVTLPESIESVDAGAFYQCFNLTTITILGSDTVMMAESLCVGTEDRTAEIHVVIPDGMQLPDNVFDEYTIAHVSIIGEEP
jgi:hypothetical protein